MQKKIEAKLPPFTSPEHRLEQVELWRPKYRAVLDVLLSHCTQVSLLEVRLWSHELQKGDYHLRVAHTFISPKQEVALKGNKGDAPEEETDTYYKSFQEWDGYDPKSVKGHLYFEYSEARGVYIKATSIQPNKSNYPQEVEDALENLRQDTSSLRI